MANDTARSFTKSRKQYNKAVIRCCMRCHGTEQTRVERDLIFDTLMIGDRALGMRQLKALIKNTDRYKRVVCDPCAIFYSCAADGCPNEAEERNTLCDEHKGTRPCSSCGRRNRLVYRGPNNKLLCINCKGGNYEQTIVTYKKV